MGDFSVPRLVPALGAILGDGSDGPGGFPINLNPCVRLGLLAQNHGLKELIWRSQSVDLLLGQQPWLLQR